MINIEVVKKLNPYIQGYCEIVEKGAYQRRPHLPKTKEGLVVGALMTRIATLSTYLMLNPASWTLNLAAFSLRTQLECYITLAWILQNVNENSKRYIVTSIRQNKNNDTEREKLLLKQENKRNAKNNAALLKEREYYEKHSATQKKWRQEQSAEWGIDCTKKKDAMPGVFDMAEDADLSFRYQDMYRGLCVYSHNSWYCVYHSNTELSADGISRISVIKQESNLILMGQSAEYLTCVYRLIDRNFGIEETKTKFPMVYWTECIPKIKKILNVDV